MPQRALNEQYEGAKTLHLACGLCAPFGAQGLHLLLQRVPLDGSHTLDMLEDPHGVVPHGSFGHGLELFDHEAQALEG